LRRARCGIAVAAAGMSYERHFLLLQSPLTDSNR
jgi:hypothetical protein